jgi:hypothetical protein
LAMAGATNFRHSTVRLSNPDDFLFLSVMMILCQEISVAVIQLVLTATKLIDLLRKS